MEPGNADFLKDEGKSCIGIDGNSIPMLHWIIEPSGML